MEEKNIHILIVEDNPVDARLVVEMLRENSDPSFETSHASRLDKALQVLENEDFDAILLDLKLPDSEGLDGLERISARKPHIPVVVLTGTDDEKMGLQALQKNAGDYLVKGKTDEHLLGRSIRYAIERKKSEAEIRKVHAKLARHTAEVQAANKALKDSRLAALNLMDDALEARRHAEQALEELRQSRQDLAHAQEVGQIGSWRLDVSRNVLTWSDENHRIFGVPKGTPMTYETFLSAVHPDDRQFVDTQWKAGAAGEPYDIEHRITVDGQVKWVREKAYLEFADTGALLGGFGITQDITSRKLAEEQIENIARFPAENPSPVLRIRSDGTILYSNPPGQVLLEQWERQVDQKAPSRWQRLVADALRQDRYLVKPVKCGGRTFSIVIAPFREGGYVNLYGEDVTVQEQAKEALRKSRDELEMRVKERTAELVRTNERLRKEIEERLRAEQTAEAERQRFNDVLETLPAYICLLTPDHRMPFANRVFRETFAYSPDKKCHEFLFNRTEPCEICQTWSVLKTNKPHHWEWTGPNGRDYDVHDFPFTDADGSRLILEMGIDITELRRAERRNQAMNALLEQFARKTSRKEYLDSVVAIIRDWSGCRCVGLRLTNTNGHIPYESHAGFSEEFLSLENKLCLETDACVCIRAISQVPEHEDAPLLTTRGSFRTNNSLEFVESLPAKAKKQYRGNCVRFGFASLAVIPIRYRDTILGAIHLADEGQNKAPQEAVAFLEDMAAMIGEAVHRFNVEESLRSSERRLLEAQRLAHLGNWDWDIIANRLLWSDEVYRIFGTTVQEFEATYEAFLSCVHPDDRDAVQQSVTEALYQQKPFDMDHRVIRLDGTERIVHARAQVTYGADREPIRMTGTVQDVTEQKRTEEEIRRSQQQLRSLAAQLQLTEERERRRLASDLHDSIGQILAFCRRELGSLQKSAPAEMAASLEEVGGQLDAAVRQARTLSFELSPSVLYDLGLEAALEDLAERFSEERRIKCRFESRGRAGPVEDAVKVLLYRFVRELLINVAKHAGASEVRISLWRTAHEVHIRVEDNGDGFDASILESRRGKPKGFGLFNIHERLSHIGGRFEIEAAKGRGTRITLVAPLSTAGIEQKG